MYLLCCLNPDDDLRHYWVRENPILISADIPGNRDPSIASPWGQCGNNCDKRV